MNGGFEIDPYLEGIAPEALRDGFYESRKHDGRFGLPLVAAWRSFPKSMESAYGELVERVSSCFVATSGYEMNSNNTVRDPDAHIYPFTDLHITIATFRTLFEPAFATDDDSAAIKRFCVNVMENATKMGGWPKESNIKLRLRPKEIRMGKTNVIILWEEMTGNLEAMRRCLGEEMEVQKQSDDGIYPVVSGLSFAVATI